MISICAGFTIVSCGENNLPTDAHEILGAPSRPLTAMYAVDPGINYSDTWVSATQVQADTTVFTTNQTILDADTGQPTNSVKVGSPVETVQLVGGYGYDGRLRVTTAYASDNPVGTQTVQQVGDATADYSQNGDQNLDALPQEPTATLGTLQYAQLDVSGGVGISCASGTCVTQSLRADGVSSAAIPIADHSIRRELIDAGHLRVTQLMPLDAPKQRLSNSSNDQSGDNAGVNDDKDTQREGKQVRDYEKHGSGWLLKHIHQETSAKNHGRSMKHMQEVEFKNLQFFSNKQKDDERKAARDKLLASLSPGTAMRYGAVTTPINGKPLIACDPDCGGPPPPPPPPPPAGYPYEPRVNEIAQVVSDQTTNLGTSQATLVLQHGFLSSSDTWRPMQRWLDRDLQFGTITRKTLNWRDTYENQAGNLRYRLYNETYIPYHTPVILVGHSNGGMIARALAHNPGIYNIAGVVTIGTPHKGTPAARSLRTLDILFGWGPFPAAAICPIFGMAGCTRFGELALQPVSAYWRSLWDPFPVVNEMQPNSSYHAAFNAQTESFPRFGIESYIWKHWEIWKQNGDMQCYPEESCGGYAEVKKTDRIYHHDISCSIVGFFTLNWAKAFKCGLDAGFLKAVDGLYNKYTNDGGDTDGIVPKWSQLYPNVPAPNQYEIYDGPFHTGETKAVVVRTRLGIGSG
ncbi:MAG: alpha/beta hydrolase [Gemmatimonadaceae bacterium]